MSRYKEDPFLRLVELYVLRAIGKLGYKEELAMIKLTPELQSIYDHQGQWFEIVEYVMEFPKGAANEITSEWKRALKQNKSLQPEDFARSFTDELFKG